MFWRFSVVREEKWVTYLNWFFKSFLKMFPSAGLGFFFNWKVEGRGQQQWSGHIGEYERWEAHISILSSKQRHKIKVLKYWKPGFNDLLLVLRHQESAIHRLGGFYYVHDPLNFYHRPYHDHNGVTCVHPNAYALFVASQTYVSGYNWDFVVHIVF